MNELEGNQRDATPHAYADAEALAETADEILQGAQPASRWLFLAERALPSEADMQSVRIWEKRSIQFTYNNGTVPCRFEIRTNIPPHSFLAGMI
ncbi:hypothetical protein [Methylosarcina fibrata]|uniref:hypothetical protein n=1 Tax=Methylosarcina fibrata TaxID=105972 RepID=UPI00036B3493|nr:hypothetical protein [Methylosarcina fibrata]